MPVLQGSPRESMGESLDRLVVGLRPRLRVAVQGGFSSDVQFARGGAGLGGGNAISVLAFSQDAGSVVQLAPACGHRPR
jgi:hypothetical protein